MIKFNLPPLDPSSCDDGVWKPFINGVHFKIARYGNTGHAMAMQDLLLELKDLPSEDIRIERVAEVMSTHILKDWKGLTTPEGEPIPYSVEVATELLSAEEYVHVQNFVERTAKDIDNFYYKEKEETAGK